MVYIKINVVIAEFHARIADAGGTAMQKNAHRRPDHALFKPTQAMETAAGGDAGVVTPLTEMEC